jgi:hypothetical protein
LISSTFSSALWYQGCQMICFQTKNINLGKFWRTLEWKMLKYFMAIRTVGVFYDHLVHFYVNLVYFSGFGIMYQEKSGNPVWYVWT